MSTGIIINMVNQIRKIRESKNISVRQLAKLTEMSHTQMSNLERNERRLNQEHMNKIAHALGVKPEDLIKENNDDKSSQISTDIVSIKLYNHKLSAGSGIKIFDEEEFTNISIDKKLLERITSDFKTLAMFFVFGDSMEPVLCDEQLVFVDRSVSEIKKDGIYAFVYGDQFYVKRIQIHPHALKVISANPNYPAWDLPLPPTEYLQIIGLVKYSFFNKL